MPFRALHFCEEFRRILTTELNPEARPEGTARFPAGLSNAAARTSDIETLDAWLTRILQSTTVRSIAVFPNLAFVAEILWRTDQVTGARTLTEVHAQALVTTGCTIDELAMGVAPAGARPQYMRADFEPANLGCTLPDPMPHVHGQSKGEPRFPISVSKSVPHVDFIELVLRNYYRTIWQSWADLVWRRRVRPGLPLGGAMDPHARIKAAFANNQHEMIMASLGEPITHWKGALVEEKHAMCRLEWHAPADVLGY